MSAVVVASLMIVRFLDRPYEDRAGSIRPVAMAETLQRAEATQAKASPLLVVPCDGLDRPPVQ